MYKTETLEPVTTKEFEQSLFVMLAIVSIFILGVYFVITYNVPAEAESPLELNDFSEQNGVLTWAISGVADDQIIQLEALHGSTWLLIGNDFAPSGQYVLRSNAEDYRLVVRDANGDLFQELSLE